MKKKDDDKALPKGRGKHISIPLLPPTDRIFSPDFVVVAGRRIFAPLAKKEGKDD